MKIQFDKPTTVYFIGIGGVSMSGLAHILLDRHFKVAGSDLHISDNTQRLVKEGATVFIGQKAENINSCLLYTSPSPRDVEESRMPSSA